MRPYAVVDFHCDTLTDCTHARTDGTDTLNDPARTLTLDNIPKDVHRAQFYAVWTPDEYRGAEARAFFLRNADDFERQAVKYRDRIAVCRGAADIEKAWREGKTAALLAVENGSPLTGSPENVALFADRGVRYVTLVWNHENEIGRGQETGGGLTVFGKELIPVLEDAGILIDVSHLSDEGFRDVVGIAKKPFIASHSNARSVCAHPRNLTDEMIRILVERGCLIGLNYYRSFLAETDGEANEPESLYRHIVRFIELGAEKHLAMGSDYDGCEVPPFLETPERSAAYAGYLRERGLSADTVEDIFWRNAMTFLKKNMP